MVLQALIEANNIKVTRDMKWNKDYIQENIIPLISKGAYKIDKGLELTKAKKDAHRYNLAVQLEQGLLWDNFSSQKYSNNKVILKLSVDKDNYWDTYWVAAYNSKGKISLTFKGYYSTYNNTRILIQMFKNGIKNIFAELFDSLGAAITFEIYATRKVPSYSSKKEVIKDFRRMLYSDFHEREILKKYDVEQLRHRFTYE